MNIIVPMAGFNNFNNKNHFYPLPLIEISNLPLIEYFTTNLKEIEGDNKFIYILKEKDCLKFSLDKVLKLLTPNCEIIKLKNKTGGAVFSVLLSVEKLNSKKECLIVNADQIFNYDLNKILKTFRDKKSDGGVITFNSVHPRWSYVKLIDDDVIEAREKTPISKNAIAGFYYFKSFELFKKCAFNAIQIEDFYNNNLYTSSVLNQLILNNKKVTNYEIDKKYYISFYTPQKIKEFELFLMNKNKK